MGGLTRRATVHGVGSIPLQTTVNVRWTRELAEVMRPFTTSSDYVNQIGLETDKGSERIKAPFVRDWPTRDPPIIGRRCKPLTGG